MMYVSLRGKGNKTNIEEQMKLVNCQQDTFEEKKVIVQQNLINQRNRIKYVQ